MSSDFAMLVALYARGWTVYPWDPRMQVARVHRAYSGYIYSRYIMV